VEISAYPLLSKQSSAEVEISGYLQRPTYASSEVDNHITTRLSDAEPDVAESYRKTDYPPKVADTLCARFLLSYMILRCQLFLLNPRVLMADAPAIPLANWNRPV
jgi:hypothetical protein